MKLFALILMTESSSKLVPRSPYVEEETDEEFLPEQEQSDVDRDERTCRICFAGEDEVEVLGKLIAPCKCRHQLLNLHFLI